MSQTFSEFSEKCLSTNVPSGVLLDIQSIAEQYSTIRNRTDSLSPSESSTLSPHDCKRTASTGHRNENTVTDDAGVLDTPFYTESNRFGWSPRVCSDGGSGVVAHANHDVERASPPSNLPDTNENYQVTFSLLHSLDIPSSYSSYERTFARRLHRASCEYAYGLACDPTRMPDLFNNVFKLTLRAAGSVERVKYSLESTLNRGIREPLSNWGVTFIHIGGAGTHYPRPPEEGGISYQSPSSWAVTTVGPHKISGSTIEEALTAEMLLRRVPGMDGEWFDAYDVEGYLAEKGIHLDPSSSYVEVEFPEDKPASTKSTLVPAVIGNYLQPLSTSEATPVTSYATHQPGFAEYLPFAAGEHTHRKSHPSFEAQVQPQSGERRFTAPSIGQQEGLGMYPYSAQQPKKTRSTIDVAEFIRRKWLTRHFG